MSYILDALKKSEKERQKKNLPDLLTVQEPVLNEKKRRKPLWPYILIAVLVVNMGFLGYLLGTKKSRKPQVSSVTAQKEQPEPIERQIPVTAKVEMPVPVAPVKTAEQPVKTARQRELKEIKGKETQIAMVSPQKKVLPDREGQERETQEKAIVQPVHPPVKKEDRVVKAQTPSAETRTPAVVAETKEEKAAHVDTSPETPPEANKVYHMGELPQSIQQALPSVNMSIFMYSDDPASRMVRINGQTYREGDTISEDVKLERIVPDGIILKYKKYRIRVGVQHP